jgi:hypothetical protein
MRTSRTSKTGFYVYGWAEQANYVGKFSWFGGRYTVGYRHWITACLEHGARIFFVSGLDPAQLGDIEAYLIQAFKPLHNSDRPTPNQQMVFDSSGQTPAQFAGWNNLPD